MENKNINAGNWTSRTNKTVHHLAIWTGGWVLTMALATFGPQFLWVDNQFLTITAIVLNLAIGLGMILANIRHLKVLDEMMQKIQLEAMGLALGLGVVGGLSYSLLDVTNIISSDAEISYLVILIALTYITAVFINHKRYQ
ncbi:hypothetical protein NC796_11105 [Aliifodinibius sp. S!AR15-10]|uniref:hypothetical protein n=1 Tax=Aliifodinibius sp. S!AR15-10 TaxID=2950437 RepID=UPI00285B3329|nr:hypothetical protein [Aliifodinibius sp. S!AR15-10]MDR8391693.1 hypothetical protein [Aliifodinibius sp. S!AR15-10]